MRSVQKVSSHMLWKETITEEDTRNIVHRTMTPQSPSERAPWHLTQFSQSPSAALLYFPESHQQSQISSLSKVISFGKSQKLQGTKSKLKGGWVTWVICCFTKKLCTRHEAWVGVLSLWSCQSSVAHRCGLLNHPNSFHGGLFKLTSKSDANLLLYLLTHFECDRHTVHMLT